MFIIILSHWTKGGNLTHREILNIGPNQDKITEIMRGYADAQTGKVEHYPTSAIVTYPTYRATYRVEFREITE